MATMYFKTGTGEPFTANAVTGEDAVARGVAVKVTNAPDNIAEWRMKYNFGTSSVDVYAGVDKTDDEAVQQQLDDNAAEVATVKAAEAQKIADMAG
tara:strand:+ start:338 stop:625 length:288 start_codon:yes stop_codon:yes gene_type:complete